MTLRVRATGPRRRRSAAPPAARRRRPAALCVDGAVARRVLERARSAPAATVAGPCDRRAGGRHDSWCPRGWTARRAPAGTLVLARRRHERVRPGHPGDPAPTRFHGVAEEMAVVEYRSSFSPIIREMLDFNCGVFDERGRMVAHSEQIPAQLGLMQFALQAALASGGADSRPATPCSPTTRTWAARTRPTCRSSSPPSSTAALIGYDGLDRPPHRHRRPSPRHRERAEHRAVPGGPDLPRRSSWWRAGGASRALYELIAANVRDPNSTLGDLDAQLAACRRGASGCDELCERHGDGDGRAGDGRRCSTRPPAARRELFAAWPARRVDVEGFLDDGGFEGTPPVRIAPRARGARRRARRRPRRHRSDQVPRGRQRAVASAHAAVYFAVRCFVGHAAAERRPHAARAPAHAPRAACSTRAFPAALSARHLAVQRLADLMVEALGELLPERAVAASHVSFPAFVFQAVDPRVGPADAAGRHPRRRRGRPAAMRRRRPRDRPVHVQLRDPAGRDRRARVPVADRAHRAGRRLRRRRARRRGGLGLRRDYRLLADARATACTTSSSATRASRPRGARAAARPGRPRDAAPGRLRRRGGAARQGLRPPRARRRDLVPRRGRRRLRPREPGRRHEGSVRVGPGVQDALPPVLDLEDEMRLAQ